MLGLSVLCVGFCFCVAVGRLVCFESFGVFLVSWLVFVG